MNRNGHELFACANCESRNLDPVTTLDRYLRCARCGSDAVAPVDRLLLPALRAGEQRPQLLIGRSL
jgi:DNA-directed RNA polymerase subunit RPC12/RpoP